MANKIVLQIWRNKPTRCKFEMTPILKMADFRFYGNAIKFDFLILNFIEIEVHELEI